MASKKKKTSLGAIVLVVIVALASRFLPPEWRDAIGIGKRIAQQQTQTPPTSPQSQRTATRKPTSQQAPKPTTSAPNDEPSSNTTLEGIESAPSEDDKRIVRAADSRESGFMVQSVGLVTKTLPDDNDGSRHQRFIIKLRNRHTVLVAHNIDLAPRVPLDEGDVIRIRGQYEWNDRGGVLHWTHHDPGGFREGGWIELDGRLYE